MLTKSLIRNKANAITYSKGVDIYCSNHIQKFSVEEEGDYDYIKALVKGSGRNRYEVSVVYDVVEELIEDIHCECPAFAGYSGICKHCVAVLLEYIDYENRQETIHEAVLKQEASLAKLQTMKGLPVKKSLTPQMKMQPTTPAIKQLLSSQLMKRTLPMIQDAMYGKVRIEPLLKCDSHAISVEFKIGITHMYVLKDIFSFDNAFEKGENITYGQKLQFNHTLEAFQEEYRQLVKFMRKWVQNNKMHHMQTVYYGFSYNYAPVKLRTIPLTNSELAEFLNAIGNRTLIADLNGTGEKEWHLTEEELPRDMVISKRNDGIEVKINKLFGYQCSNENIYFDNGKIYRVSQNNMEPILEFLKCMADIPERIAYIQKEDVPTFCRELLPDLEKFFTCRKVDFNEKDYGVVPVTFEIYLDAPQKDFITCQVMAVYGETKYNIYSKIEMKQMRDQVREMEVGKIVSSFCNAYDEKELFMVVADDEEKIYELIVDGIPRMQEVAEVYISDALKRLKVTSAPKVSVGVSISGELLELTMTSEDMSKEQLIEILLKYNRKKKFYRLKNGEFVNVEGEEIEALLELKQGLNLTESQLKHSTIQIPKYRSLYLDAELKEKKSLSAMKDKAFKALVRNMKTVEDNDFDVPDTLENVMREYQKRGFLWIKTLKNNGFGGILADDMGLGKTLQVLCFLLSEYLEAGEEDNKRTLIVCPASLVYNWKNEIEKFAPVLPAKMVIGTALEREEMIQNSGRKEVLITSYDLLKRDINHYEKITFHCQIIDEAQFIKNHNTQAAKAVKVINAGFKLALTGTPIENRLSELWSIFDYLMPGFLYSYQRFKEELETPIVQNQEEKAIRRLQKMIAPFVLRRLKKEVLTDLPDKLEENIYAKLEAEQQKLYDAHVKKLQLMLGKQSEEEFKNSKIQILSELTKLRQICCDPALLFEDYKEGSAKVEMCMDLIQNAISGDHKVLLFSQFTSMLENIQKRLRKENIQFYTLTGATSKENRANMVEKFNKDTTPVFCISLKAGGTGLNLTSADIVIHFDPWWNLAVQNQATDRAHRIGQKNVVNVYKLIVKGTIEENIIKLQEKKKELADQVLNGETMGGGSFTKEELLELLEYGG
jgi:hypothetical protein